MDILWAAIVSVLAALVTAWYNANKAGDEKIKREVAEAKLRTLESKNKLRDAMIAREGAKIGYEKAKEEFNARFGNPNDPAGGTGKSK